MMDEHASHLMYPGGGGERGLDGLLLCGDHRNAPPFFPYSGGRNPPFHRYERDWRMTDIAEAPGELDDDDQGGALLIEESPSSLLLESFTLTVKRIAVWNVLYVDDDLSAFSTPVVDATSGRHRDSLNHPPATGGLGADRDIQTGSSTHGRFSPGQGGGDSVIPSPPMAGSPKMAGGAVGKRGGSTSPEGRPGTSSVLFDDTPIPHLTLPQSATGGSAIRTLGPQPGFTGRQQQTSASLIQDLQGPVTKGTTDNRGGSHHLRSRLVDSQSHHLQLPSHLEQFRQHLSGKWGAAPPSPRAGSLPRLGVNGEGGGGGSAPLRGSGGGPDGYVDSLSEAKSRLLVSHLRSSSHSHPAALASAAAAAGALASTGHQGFFSLNPAPLHIYHSKAREGAHAAITAGAIAAAEAAADVSRTIHRRRSRFHDYLMSLKSGGERRSTVGGGSAGRGLSPGVRGEAIGGEVDYGGATENGRRPSYGGVPGTGGGGSEVVILYMRMQQDFSKMLNCLWSCLSLSLKFSGRRVL